MLVHMFLLQTMELAPAATRGHRSAASFATGPVMAEPGRGVREGEQKTGSLAGRTLHLALRVHDHSRVVCEGAGISGVLRSTAACRRLRTLEVDEEAVLSPPRLALADHHARHHCARRRVSWRREAGTPHRAGSPFLRRSGFPFFTGPMNMSPGAAPGRRFSRAPQPGERERREAEIRTNPRVGVRQLAPAHP